jgi:hypothetical protein
MSAMAVADPSRPMSRHISDIWSRSATIVDHDEFAGSDDDDLNPDSSGPTRSWRSSSTPGSAVSISEHRAAAKN